MLHLSSLWHNWPNSILQLTGSLSTFLSYILNPFNLSVEFIQSCLLISLCSSLNFLVCVLHLMLFIFRFYLSLCCSASKYCPTYLSWLPLKEQATNTIARVYHLHLCLFQSFFCIYNNLYLMTVKPPNSFQLCPIYSSGNCWICLLFFLFLLLFWWSTWIMFPIFSKLK